jgi:hypothetical protein
MTTTAKSPSVVERKPQFRMGRKRLDVVGVQHDGFPKPVAVSTGCTSISVSLKYRSSPIFIFDRCSDDPLPSGDTALPAMIVRSPVLK